MNMEDFSYNIKRQNLQIMCIEEEEEIQTKSTDNLTAENFSNLKKGKSRYRRLSECQTGRIRKETHPYIL
jgi:hypothetical protein